MSRVLRHALLYAAIVIAANAVALVTVARDAGGDPNAIVMLTEREARLVEVDAENTGMLLSFEWDGRLDEVRPAWFTAARLAALGFDCSVDPASKGADRHYRSAAILPRPMYLAVSILPAAPSDEHLRPDQVPFDRARAAGGVASRSEEERQRASRLVVIDAGPDAGVLRAAHPDRHSTFVTRGVVRLAFIPSGPDGPAHLEGRVVRIEPELLWVPSAQRAALKTMAPARSRFGLALDHDPRYEVAVRYGADLLPAIVGIKRLTQ